VLATPVARAFSLKSTVSGSVQMAASNVSPVSQSEVHDTRDWRAATDLFSRIAATGGTVSARSDRYSVLLGPILDTGVADTDFSCDFC
jgi:hypothetical protein